jgi:hypothetical protein
VIDASNLGQIIGRLMAERADEVLAPGPKRSGVAERIRAVLQQAAEPMSGRQIAAVDGVITSNQVATNITHMSGIERTGAPYKYRYAMRKKSPQP